MWPCTYKSGNWVSLVLDTNAWAPNTLRKGMLVYYLRPGTAAVGSVCLWDVIEESVGELGELVSQEGRFCFVLLSGCFWSWIHTRCFLHAPQATPLWIYWHLVDVYAAWDRAAVCGLCWNPAAVSSQETNEELSNWKPWPNSSLQYYLHKLWGLQQKYLKKGILCCIRTNVLLQLWKKFGN